MIKKYKPACIGFGIANADELFSNVIGVVEIKFHATL
jgi:hypothetical protein